MRSEADPAGRKHHCDPANSGASAHNRFLTECFGVYMTPNSSRHSELPYSAEVQSLGVPPGSRFAEKLTLCSEVNFPQPGKDRLGT